MLKWKDVISRYKQPYNIWNTSKHDDNPEHACNRMHADSPNYSIVPKFSMPKDTSFFTIGSCFARNIERALIARGNKVNNALYESKLIAAADTKYGDAALLHRFNAPSMQLEIENYTDHTRLADHLIYPHTSRELYWDCHYGGNQEPRPLQDVMDGRDHIRSAMSTALAEAGCVILTLGLSEAVYDQQAGLYLNGAPPGRYANKSDRFTGEWISAQQTLDCLEAIRQRTHDHAGWPVKFIVTVSPVGLRRSFSGDDILVSNMLSKSQLRVAAAQFSDAHDDVDYFPSYEMVMLSNPSSAWLPDKRHVGNALVGKITEQFCQKYIEQT